MGDPLPVKASYEAGDAKPPEEHLFQNGKSDNPNGRPTGARRASPSKSTLVTACAPPKNTSGSRPTARL